MSNKVKFYNGNVNQNFSSNNTGAICFDSDSRKIFLNGQPYGGLDLNPSSTTKLGGIKIGYTGENTAVELSDDNKAFVKKNYRVLTKDEYHALETSNQIQEDVLYFITGDREDYNVILWQYI